jgi:hypothetical protein
VVAAVWFTAAAQDIIDLKSFVSTPVRQYLIPSSVYALKMDVFVSKSLSFTDWAFFVSDMLGISLLFAGACTALMLAMTSRLGRLLE